MKPTQICFGIEINEVKLSQNLYNSKKTYIMFEEFKPFH